MDSGSVEGLTVSVDIYNAYLRAVGVYTRGGKWRPLQDEKKLDAKKRLIIHRLGIAINSAGIEAYDFFAAPYIIIPDERKFFDLQWYLRPRAFHIYRMWRAGY